MIKYGLLVNKNMGNLGDDVQSYASEQFLPRVDVDIDREALDDFKYGDGTDPVALIMGAWFMHKKWNWPPSKQIFPLMAGYHHFNRCGDIFESVKFATGITDAHYDGVGGEWMKAYGPVGCRDNYTVKVLENKNIPAYFSGCVTLTLPKQKDLPDKGTYVCLIDLPKQVEAKVKALIGDKYEIRYYSHRGAPHSKSNLTWSQRSKDIEKRLTIYQNAKYIVTPRLHVALPCLAMEVPVLVVINRKMNDPERFDPYSKWLNYYWTDEFMKDKYTFDWENGTPNKDDYKEYRDSMTKTMKEFISYCEKNKNKDLSFFCKTKYTEQERLAWQNKLLKYSLDSLVSDSKALKGYYKGLNDPSKSIMYNSLKRLYYRKIKGKKLDNSKIIKKLKGKFAK